MNQETVLRYFLNKRKKVLINYSKRSGKISVKVNSIKNNFLNGKDLTNNKPFRIKLPSRQLDLLNLYQEYEVDHRKTNSVEYLDSIDMENFIEDYIRKTEFNSDCLRCKVNSNLQNMDGYELLRHMHSEGYISDRDYKIGIAKNEFRDILIEMINDFREELESNCEQSNDNREIYCYNLEYMKSTENEDNEDYSDED